MQYGPLQSSNVWNLLLISQNIVTYMTNNMYKKTEEEICSFYGKLSQNIFMPSEWDLCSLGMVVPTSVGRGQYKQSVVSYIHPGGASE